MQLIFHSRRLERAYQEPRRATRLWGPVVGPQFVRRLARLELEPSWEDLFRVRTLNLHPLHGGRAGDFALRLTGGWRLIVQPGSERDQIIIIGVEDYHG